MSKAIRIHEYRRPRGPEVGDVEVGFPGRDKRG